MKIAKKNILITGGASGLGFATAHFCASLNANVFLLDNNLELAKKSAAEINATAFECDVTSEESVKNVMAQCNDIHAVINCAGILHSARLVGKNGAMPLLDFSRVIQINLIGTFNVMRLVAEKMSQQNLIENNERGIIINTASIAAFEGQIGQVAYSASKGGVLSMTLPAARELSRFGIRVMTIAPGIMQTPMVSSLSEAAQQSLSVDIPFPKQLGDPHSFAKLAVHIIENDYLNGSIIRLDGALRLR